ncbi:MAG: FKBP-type peptidyl-prolyl cis-trans isomerase [Candidatus Bathyarchaeia archaeon]|jgi:FKBP-type peptidyl-prolyl cis-trans isomerase 2
MSLEKGSFILVDYVAKVKETGEVFDTTFEETAKKEHLFKEGDIYEPKLVVIGEGWVIKALDESLTTMEVDKAAVVEIPPDKAFGPRDPEKVKRVPLRQLLAKDITPTLGKRVEFGGKTATVRAVGAGRVLLDFNPALAGKTLVYDTTVKKKLETKNEKIAALVHRRISAVEQGKFQFILKPKIVSIEMPEEAFYLEGIQIAKRGIAADIQRFLEGITTVKFAETFKAEPKKTETKPETEAEAKKTEAKPEEEAEKETAKEAPEETKGQTAETEVKT